MRLVLDTSVIVAALAAEWERAVNCEMILEAAINGQADVIGSYNIRDFLPAARTFGSSVDTWRSYRKKVEGMSEAVIPVRMSDPLLEAASSQASRTGQSLEDRLLELEAERVRGERASQDFFRRASKRSEEENRKALSAFLDRAPDLPPMPGDELPEGWSPQEPISSAELRHRHPAA